jgi:branched-chain amino acid transport system substrate-binding protein
MLKRAIVGLVAGCAVAMTGLGPVMAKDADPIRVGLIMPTKSLLGAQAVQAANVAVEMIAEDGGVLGGRNIELIVYDDAFSPVEGVAAAQRLIDQDEVKFIVGQFSSTVALAMVPLAEQAGILYIAAVPKHPDVTASGYDKVFRLNTTTVMDGEVFGEFLTEELKPDSIAYLGENNDFGRQMLDQLKELLADKPNQGIAYSGLFDVTQSDFNAMLTEASASGADTLFTGGSSVEQYANIIRGAAELGFRPEHVVLAPGTLNQRVPDLAGEAAEGAVSVDIYIPSFDNPLNERFVAAYEGEYGDKPEKTEELTFEGVWILAKAIEEAGTADDVDAVAQAIREGAWETPRGVVRFDESGQAQSEAFVIKVQDGEIVRY